MPKSRVAALSGWVDGMSSLIRVPSTAAVKKATALTRALCAAHHRDLHTVGDEQKWRRERKIDPIAHAAQLWKERQVEDIQQPSRARELIRPTPS